ncbi:MAG: EAL domain-containing protein [Pseudomonadota bacterium]
MKWCGQILAFPVVVLLSAALTLIAGAARLEAQDLKAIKLEEGQQRLAIVAKSLVFDGQGDNFRVNTAADADGIRRLMSVRAQQRGSNPTWLVFALDNTTEKPITRWLTAARYDIIGSGLIWPDLDSDRIRAITPSVGFIPQKIDNERADIFQITIPPGQIVTFVAELAAPRVARIDLWEPVKYELYIRDRRLFNGIMLGITGLLGVFLTALFAANHKAMFPSAALVAWCVLAYLCVDFGFWHKLLQLNSEDNAIYRAATEAAMAASLAIFLYTFLRLGSWHGFARMLALVWIVAALTLVFVAVLDPRLASTFARLSFLGLGAAGGLVMLFFAIRGQDRALSLIPTWLLFLVWLFGAASTLNGQLNGDIVVSSLVAGLTLVVVLLGFTVTQFAFGSREQLYAADPNEQSLRSLAVDGAGAAVWDWNARREEIKISPIIEASLGLNLGELSSKVDDFLKHVHPADQERFRLQLASVQEHGEGVIRTDLRMRHNDNSYRWFNLEAASIPTIDRRSLRCIGLMRDITDIKRTQARLMYDAIYDNLTGLPNQELFLDRLVVTISRAKHERNIQPKVICIDIDKVKNVNTEYGPIVGDSLLLTLAKRLRNHISNSDTLARIGDERFAILTLSRHTAGELQRLADDIYRSIRTPINIAGHNVVLSGAVGIAVYDGHAKPETEDNELLKEAEIAMYRAKRQANGQAVLFRPEMRNAQDDRAILARELKEALEHKQLKLLFQPVIHLPREELSGFEALLHWQHPKRGLLGPGEFISIAEDNGLVVQLGSYAIVQAVEQIAKWHKELPRTTNPLFVSINISSRQLLRPELIQEIRHIVGRSIVPDGVLRLEIAEPLVMENPEQANEMLESMVQAGARLSLDDFGTGYSSLTYLQRFPFDTIKIDRDLVVASGGSDAGAEIVRSIVALARELGKQVVAEGVEDAEDASFLRSIGCEYAQGFYYGDPMREQDVSNMLKIVRKSERKLRRSGFFRPKSATEEAETQPQTAGLDDKVEKPSQLPPQEIKAPALPQMAPEAGQLAAQHQRPYDNAYDNANELAARRAPSPPPGRGQTMPQQTPAPIKPSTPERPSYRPVQQPNSPNVQDTQWPRHQRDQPEKPVYTYDGTRVPPQTQPLPHTPADKVETRIAQERQAALNNYSQSRSRSLPSYASPEEKRNSRPQDGAAHSQMPPSHPPGTGDRNTQSHMTSSAQPINRDKAHSSLLHRKNMPPPSRQRTEGEARLPHEVSPLTPESEWQSAYNPGQASQDEPRPPPPVSLPDLSKLPPGIAASLGRLAGLSEAEIEKITSASRRKKS